MVFSNLILTPLKGELIPLIEEINRRTETSVERVLERNGYYCPSLDSYIGFAGHGKVDYALWASRYLEIFPKAKKLILAGAAGGLKTYPIGQAVVADKTIEHDYHEKFDDDEPPTFYSDKELLSLFSKESEVSNILSGDEDIVDSLRANQLRQRFDAGCVAWEGAGGARAARLHKVGFIEIRGVTDQADKFAPEHFKQNLQLAMTSVGQLLMRLSVESK